MINSTASVSPVANVLFTPCLWLLWSLTLRHAAWHVTEESKLQCTFLFSLTPVSLNFSNLLLQSLTVNNTHKIIFSVAAAACHLVSCMRLREPTVAYNLPNVPNVFRTPPSRYYISLSSSQLQHWLKKNATSSAWLFRRMGWFQIVSDIPAQKERKQTFTTQSRETELKHKIVSIFLTGKIAEHGRECMLVSCSYK